MITARNNSPPRGPLGHILAHRGLWSRREERNTRAALHGALVAGFGLETDVRDFGSRIVLSHDPPGGDALPLQALLDDYVRWGADGVLALNIKSDGLAAAVRLLLAEYEIDRYFVFDMSVPDLLAYARAGVPYYTRLSEYEPQPALYERAAGVWLDAFERPWYDRVVIERHFAAGKQVCVVSPELHGREHLPTWALLDRLPPAAAGQLLVCTDHPREFVAARGQDVHLDGSPLYRRVA